MIRRANRPPSPEQLREMLIAAFAMGVVITSAYFILFVLKP